MPLLTAIVSLLAAATGCRQSAPGPSFVLAVLDTTRADAVSAYGTVAGSTPTVDALARSGLLYEHAYANANWTVPSHASMFTGMLPSQHGLSSGNETLKPLPTLAELLQRAGYETVGMTENPWLVLKNGISRGFESFRLSDGDLTGMVRQWARARKPGRPFLLFINLMDPHEPYEVRQANPFLPAGVSPAAARAVDQSLAHYICATTPDDPALAVLRGLYLGDVQAADAKLGAVLQELDGLTGSEPPVVIVTSDHGQYLGEHWRIGHVIGVDEPVLHVPLVVHGLPGVSSARIKAPVQLADLLPSVLTWIHAPVPADLAGEPLPTSEAEVRRIRPIIAEYDDYFRINKQFPSFLGALKVNMEQRCTPEQRMFGDMRAIIQYPHKLVWYSKYTPQLFDLRTDPAEERDLASSLPAAAAALRSELDGVLVAAGDERGGAHQPLNPDVVERLRALGYFDREEE